MHKSKLQNDLVRRAAELMKKKLSLGLFSSDSRAAGSRQLEEAHQELVTIEKWSLTHLDYETSRPERPIDNNFCEAKQRALFEFESL